VWRRIALILIVSSIFYSKTRAQSSNTISDTSLSRQAIRSADSIKLHHYTSFLATVATSFTENRNWQTMDYRNYSFLGNIDYTNKVNTRGLNHLYQVRGELGFLKFLDSTWYKNSDNLNILAQWTENSSNRITHSYSVLLKSQFADTWKYNTDMNGNSAREWRGGLLNPLTFLVAYGLNYDFWKRCFLNFAFATIKINARPRYDAALLPTEKELARTEKFFIISEYGLSMQSGISKKIYENVFWDNKTQFFANGINKNQVTLDFQNRLTIVFVKCFQFRGDTHIVYDPLYSYRLQYKQEFFFGVFLEIKREK
jgi:hypothetical protein